MLGNKNGLAPRIQQWADSHPAAALWVGTALVAILAVMVSFTPAYADNGCPDQQYGYCIQPNQPNPCAGSCNDDNYGDMCTDNPPNIIVAYNIQGDQNNWTVCSQPGTPNLNFRCTEDWASCGIPNYYYVPATGTGGNGNCVLKCSNAKVWVGCQAKPDGDNCPP